MEDSIFTKIIRGDIPSEKIYEDDTAFVMLDIAPMSPGHMLVILKQQIDSLWDVSNDDYHHLMSVAKNMTELIDKAYDYKRVGLVVEGFGVPHAHIHVFGLTGPLEQMTIQHAASKRNLSLEELKVEGDKLRAFL